MSEYSGDNYSTLSWIRNRECIATIMLWDAQSHNDEVNVQYYEGKKAAYEEMISYLQNSKVNQRPHVGFKV